MIQFHGSPLDLSKKTYVMGILNVTPDSFSDGGKFTVLENAIFQAEKMVSEGADFIDIGGESTRPGHDFVSEEVEMERVIPVIKALKARIQVPISIDTYKASVATAAIEAGASMINDVWGFQRDLKMPGVAAKYQVPAVLMHNQEGTHYEGDIIESMISFFEKSIQLAVDAGVLKSQIILDPGIGFGKTAEQNIEVMSRIRELNQLGLPILLGTSRKSMIGYILDLPPEKRLEGTLATNILGVTQGVSIVRVHDVEAHVRALKVTDAIIKRQ